MKTRGIHIIVQGMVQGVFFRAATVTEAKRLGLTGWVANRPDGTVEIVAEGEESAVEKLAQWSKRGPSSARVENTKNEKIEPTGNYDSFSIKH